MVIVIHQASSTANAFFYNERKSKEGKATFYHSRNTPSTNPFIYSAQHRHQIFNGQNQKESYRLMSQMLKEAGHPIVFSLCEWGGSKPWEWAAEVGHLWRTTGDIASCFDCEQKHPGYSNWGVTKILDMQKDIRQYAGPGHWNDPDMLQVGNGGKTVNEDRAHFSMWCMLAAPLMAGNDLKNMSQQTPDILTNIDAIDINQDALGIQGLKYKS